MRRLAHVIDGPPHRFGGMGSGRQRGSAPFNGISDGRHGVSSRGYCRGRLGLAAFFERAVGHGEPVDLYQCLDDSLRQDAAEAGTYPAFARTAAMTRSWVAGSRYGCIGKLTTWPLRASLTGVGALG